MCSSDLSPHTASCSSPAQVKDARAMIWQLPVMVTRNALQKGVPARISTDKELARDKKVVAVEVFPPAMDPVTLVYARKGHKLVKIITLRRGVARPTTLSGHKKFAGVVVPCTMASKIAGRGTSMTVNHVVINPKITVKDITK